MRIGILLLAFVGLQPGCAHQTNGWKHASQVLPALVSELELHYDNIEGFVLADALREKQYRIAVLYGGSTAWAKGGIGLISDNNALNTFVPISGCYGILRTFSLVKDQDTIAILRRDLGGTDMLSETIVLYTIRDGLFVKTFECEGKGHSYFPGSCFERNVSLKESKRRGALKAIQIVSQTSWYSSRESAFADEHPIAKVRTKSVHTFNPEEFSFFGVAEQSDVIP